MESNKLETIAREVIDAAFQVHIELGPGLLESAYETCLCFELHERNIRFERQKELPIIYKGKGISAGYRLDLLVEESLIVELKSVEAVHPIHSAQLLTYMKLAKCELGLLINFNTKLLRDGLKRYTLKGKV
jgi:GxxExxY protein